MEFVQNQQHEFPQVPTLLLLYRDAVRPRLIWALCCLSSATGGKKVRIKLNWLKMERKDAFWGFTLSDGITICLTQILLRFCWDLLRFDNFQPPRWAKYRRQQERRRKREGSGCQSKLSATGRWRKAYFGLNVTQIYQFSLKTEDERKVVNVKMNGPC